MQEIEFILDPETGLVTQTTIDLLEDYWNDFLHFRRDAIVSAQDGERLRTQRCLRSALFAQVNYLTGMANRWIQAEPSNGEVATAGAALSDRLTEIAVRFRSDAPPGVDLDLLTSLALRCSNLRPSDERDLFHSLSVEVLDPPWQRVVAWLQGFQERTGLQIHANTRLLASPFMSAHAGTFKEDYQDFEAFKDDPLAFQDPPGTWEKIGPASDQPPGVD